MSDHLRVLEGKSCLNGWWDFQPLDGPPPAPVRVPESGWAVGKYLVPSWWTKPTDAVRRRGEKYYRSRPDLWRDPNLAAGAGEFLYDAFGYPDEWSRTRSGWARRRVRLGALPPDHRRYLCFEAVMPRATLWINGRSTGAHIHPTLPFEVDVTADLREGDNEIAVLIEDYERDERGRPRVPTGNWVPFGYSGIWQDVWLIERGAVFVSDVTIRTSTRQRTLNVRWEITNCTSEPRRVELRADVCPWRRGSDPRNREPLLVLPRTRLDVPGNGTVVHEATVPWPRRGAWWYPEAPALHWIVTTLSEEGRVWDVSAERFGFREIWIDGPHLRLNGYVLHLFSDWGHKLAPYYMTEAWIRKWFGMIRDANMNHTRLHTHPHPRLTLELADEEGILVTGETGLHGSGAGQAAESPDYWAAARDHIRRFVRRDKNHPCIILWSVGNEMRWNSQDKRMILDELPHLRKLFGELDPTRPAYHEGDSSLWNEREQLIVSRHYDKACCGVGWWDRAQPLHAGEMALYHYSGPNNTLHLAGDHAFAEFRAVDVAAATDAAWIIEAGRALGVCCFGPWNLSCLENLRMDKRDVRLRYRDYTAPGVKPLRVPAHSSEFAFWKRGRGYTPHFSFQIQAHACRPFAVLDLSRKCAYFAGTRLARRLTCVNDTPGPVSGTLTVTLRGPGKRAPLCRAVWRMRLERGGTAVREVRWTLPAAARGRHSYTVEFRDQRGRRLDQWSRPLTIVPRRLAAPQPRGQRRGATPWAVYGPGSLRAALVAAGVEAHYLPELTTAALRPYRHLILEGHTVQAGTNQNQLIRDFVRDGGRVLVLEQSVSLFANMPLEEHALQTNWIRARGHPVFAGLSDRDLAFWGEDPYPLSGGDNAVALRLYRKDAGADALFLADGGEGGFGTGDLELASLLEARVGQGLVLACQLRLEQKLATEPAAERLFLNLLRRLETYAPPVPSEVEIFPGSVTDPHAVAACVARARAGVTVLVEDAKPEALQVFGRVLKRPLRPCVVDPVYQAVRVKNDPLLAGVSNADTCGIETWSYSDPKQARNWVVATTVLAPVRGLEPLLETATRSALYEMFVLDGRSEPLRAHTLSRFLHAERPARGVVLGRIRVGRGQILFNQFAPEPGSDRVRFRRLRNRLLANLGRAGPETLLDGAAVPLPAGRGDGIPRVIHVLNRPVGPEEARGFREATRYIREHIASTPILGAPGWTRREQADGVWSAAGLDLGAPVYLYSVVISPVPRNEPASNLGVPNPDALTHLDLEGEGEVELTLNASGRPPARLQDGRATFADLPLEQGANHLLLVWRPASAGSTLRLRWRTLHGQPEAALTFA